MNSIQETYRLITFNQREGIFLIYLLYMLALYSGQIAAYLSRNSHYLRTHLFPTLFIRIAAIWFSLYLVNHYCRSIGYTEKETIDLTLISLPIYIVLYLGLSISTQFNREIGLGVMRRYFVMPILTLLVGILAILFHDNFLIMSHASWVMTNWKNIHLYRSLSPSTVKFLNQWLAFVILTNGYLEDEKDIAEGLRLDSIDIEHTIGRAKNSKEFIEKVELLHTGRFPFQQEEITIEQDNLNTREDA